MTGTSSAPERDWVVMLGAASFGTRVLLTATMLPLIYAISPALFGGQERPAWTPLLVLGWCLGVLGFRDRRFWRLNHAARRCVIRTQRTGRPSGNLELDLFALERLESAHRRRGSRWSEPALVVLCAGIVAAAALRADPLWWWAAFSLIPVTAFALCWNRLSFADPLALHWAL